MFIKNIFLPLLLTFGFFIKTGFLADQVQSGQPKTGQASDSTEQKYRQDIDSWHEQRIRNLKSEHGWLSLIARDWLKDGTNEIPSIGTITVTKGKVNVTLLPEITATIDGQPFTTGMIRTDADSSGPDKVIFGSKAFIIIKRGDQLAIRMWDSNAETLKNFKGIDRYPVSTAWRIEAKWESYKKPKKIKLASVVPNLINESLVPGAAIFKVNGIDCRLEPVEEEGSDQLFFIFADKTNGTETYDAGRFLYAEPPKNQKIIIDFNKAYNPPCAFTQFATCPLPPSGNKLKISVTAGEKKYGDHF